MPDRTRWRQGMLVVGLYALCIATALVISALLIAITGGPWGKVLSAMLDGAFRRPGRWGGTLTEAAPVLIVALGAILTARAGLVNIGQEGQLVVGAACAAFFATKHSGPVVLLVALVAGFLGGALWAGIAAALKYWRKVPEVITTLLLVFIASQLVGYFLTRRFLLLDPDPTTGNRVQASAQVDAATRLPTIRLWGNSFPVSVLVAVALAVLVAVVLDRTVRGFKLKMLGLNPRTAQRAGVSIVFTGAITLALGGAFAGLAGGLMLTGGASNYRFTPGFANNVGWQGLLVALVARNRPLVAIPVALVFGALRTGAGFLAATGVQREIVDVVRALLVLALLAPAAIMALRSRPRRQHATDGDPNPTAADAAPAGVSA